MLAGQTEHQDGALLPEFLLAAACCRWPPSAERETAVRVAAKRGADWDRFLHLVKRHRVPGLVNDALRSTAIALPSSAAYEMVELVQLNVRHNLKLAAETSRLQNLLAAVGIPAIALKGAALEQLAYSSLSFKQTRDIDLLVPPERAEAALQLLERDGYTLSLPAERLSRIQRRALFRYGREIELVDLRTRLRLELQWRAADNAVLLQGIDAHAATQTVTPSDGVSLRTLAPDNLFAYLCVHGAHHSWSRLKWLADLNALIATSQPDIEHLFRHAQKIGAGICAGQALLLCQRLFGLKLPDVIARDLEVNGRCQRLVAIAIAAMVAHDAPTDRDGGIRGVIRELRNQLLLGRGLRF